MQKNIDRTLAASLLRQSPNPFRRSRMPGTKSARRSRANGKKPATRSAPQSKTQGSGKPKPPFPPQHQPKPGLESEITPRPRYEAPQYKGSGKLQGKVALITGGDSGIGRAVAVLYARERADVAIVYLPEEESDAEQTRDAVQEHGRECLLIPGDVTDPEFCQRAVQETLEEFGQLDILVNNAAFQNSQENLEEISEQQWD